jgi:alkylation response protein AidB-like acyl-CoA dehydrogenase
VDFGWTEEQERYRESVLRFAERELAAGAGDRDERCELSREAWRKCAAFGIQGLPVPEAYGGQGADPLTMVVALEALGYACPDSGLLFSLGAHMWSCELPIVRFGTEAQRRRYLPGLCDGTLIGVQAMSEPESGSDAFSLAATAVPSGDGYALTGGKTFVTNAPVADLFVVFARLEGRDGFGGVTAFLVERGTPGLAVGPPMRKMGLRTSPMAEVALTGCEVPADAVLGAPGSGAAVFATSIDWERGMMLAPALGTMQRQLDACVRYARERQQFGQPIGKFQAVSGRIVDMAVRLETSRLLIYRLAWRRGEKKRPLYDSALAKLHVSESLVQSSLDALQVHGGAGYLVETGLERDVRDAVGSRIYSGTSEIQRAIVARGLGL